MATQANDLLEQLDRHLALPNQSWLFGAGISKAANIPLMDGLTARVRTLVEGTEHTIVVDALFDELPPSSHIEHLLSHLGDYASLAERSKLNTVVIGDKKVAATDLIAAHDKIVQSIAETVRWGYQARIGENPEKTGEFSNPLVSVDGHKEFVQALFATAQAGLQDRRGPIHLFSVNYDTLLEDALALCAITYWDGFAGGAVAFRNYHFGEKEPQEGYRAHVIKLHGSIDWYLCDDGRVWRVREGDAYPTRTGRVLIYPQATKYVATQRDPFAAQFDLFRRTLSTSADNVLSVCGYGFGDAHINQEVESAMSAPDNRTTMVVFCCEGTELAECLRHWQRSAWSKRLYLITEKGLYVGLDGPHHSALDGKPRGWWTFEGVTKLLLDGAEASV